MLFDPTFRPLAILLLLLFVSATAWLVRVTIREFRPLPASAPIRVVSRWPSSADDYRN